MGATLYKVTDIYQQNIKSVKNRGEGREKGKENKKKKG